MVPISSVSWRYFRRLSSVSSPMLRSLRSSLENILEASARCKLFQPYYMHFLHTSI